MINRSKGGEIIKRPLLLLECSLQIDTDEIHWTEQIHPQLMCDVFFGISVELVLMIIL